MSKTLSVLELQAHGATLAHVLKAAGRHEWPEKALAEHKEMERVQAQPRLYQQLYAQHPLLPLWALAGLAATGLVCGGVGLYLTRYMHPDSMVPPLAMVTSAMLMIFCVSFYGSLRKWETTPVEIYTKLRGNPLPREASKLMMDIKSVLGNSAMFHVSHIGSDPILELELPIGCHYYTEGMDFVPILVWDIIDGKAVVVHPPT